MPLGKLDNERLVPVDESTTSLIEKLQNTGDGQSKTWLLESAPNERTKYHRFANALRQACEDIPIDGRMTTHRLRHTYATTLLNGGVSLVTLMKLLGHRSYRMSLRYAAVTQETIGKEYYLALSQLENNYAIQFNTKSAPKESDPIRLLDDVARLIQHKLARNSDQKRVARPLIKKIRRLQSSILDLQQ